MCKVLRCREVGQVAVVAEDIDCMSGAFEVMVPGFKWVYDCEEFLVVDVIVAFGWELLKYASNLCLYDLIRFFIAFRCLTPLTITGTYAHRLRASLYICPAFFLVCSDLFLWL
jgi:hypothetical protein